MKKLLLLLVSLFVIASSYAGKWDNYKTGYYAMVYSVSEDGNMYCTLSKEYQTEVGDVPSQRSFTVYTDATADIQVNLTGDSRFQLTKTPTVTDAYSTYARAYIYYTFDVTGLEPSSTPHTATITITRGDQVVTCSLSEVYIPEPDPTAGPVLDGEFSVSATQKVKFTRGNLYWDGSNWAMESAQERIKTTWRTDHIGLLYWGSAEQAIATSSSYSETQLFCDGSDESHKLTLEDAEGLYAMDKDQWNYLLFTRSNAENLYKYPVTVNGVSGCMVIAPDNYEGEIETYYSQGDFLAAQENGLVCLPPPGTRYGTTIYSSSSPSYFQYWTSTVDNEAYASAYFMHATNSNEIEVVSGYYTSCYGIRLVQDVDSTPTDPGDEPGDDEPGDDPEDPADLTNYFWLQNLSGEASQFIMINRNIEYSTTPTVANSWVKINNTYVNIAAGEKVYLRASEEGNTNLSGNPLSIECNYKVGGDITTLLNANGNVMALPAPGDNGYGNTFGVFENFFTYDTNLQDVSELVLPSTTLAEYCYAGMFRGCSNITTAPVLPATVLVNKCYDQMFNGCSNLNYVEACFSEWPQKTGGYSPYAATENWLNGVASTGTFKTHDWVRNNYSYYSSTYPSGWEREDLASMNITVSAVGYTTFYYDRNWVMPEGMEGYVAYDKYNNGSYDFIFEKVFDAGDIVSWNQPLVLKANAGTYTINFTNDSATPFVNGDEYLEFGGSVLTKDLANEYNSSNYYWYALSLDQNGENVGFYWMKDEGAAFTNAPFKAYLHISKTHFQNGAAKRAFSFDEASDANAINAVATPEKQAEGIFDLSGRRLNSIGKSGIYIINGKKVLK